MNLSVCYQFQKWNLLDLYIGHSLVKIKYCPPRLSKDQEENRWKHQREEDDDQTLQRRNQPAGNPALPHYQKDVSVMLHVQCNAGMRFLSGCWNSVKKKTNKQTKPTTTLECIKTAVFDTRNPKSPYTVGGPPPTTPPPPPPHTPRSVATLPRHSVNSLPRYKVIFLFFSNISSLIPVYV